MTSEGYNKNSHNSPSGDSSNNETPLGSRSQLPVTTSNANAQRDVAAASIATTETEGSIHQLKDGSNTKSGTASKGIDEKLDGIHQIDDDDIDLEEVDKIPEEILRPTKIPDSSDSGSSLDEKKQSKKQQSKKKKKKGGGGFMAKLTGEKIIQKEAGVNLSGKHSSSGDDDDGDGESEAKGKILDLPPVKFSKLFQYSDKTDRLLMLIGTVCALIVGVATPVMTIVFAGLMGDFTDYAILKFEKHDEDGANHLLMHSARKYCLYFLIIGLVMLVCGYIMHATWTITSERQGFHIRNLYYKSILRQDIGWFDTIATGDLTTRISGDVNMIQDAVGDKVGFTLQFVATFISAFIIAFAKGWKLAFVMCGVLPLLVLTAWIMGKVIARWMSMGQDFYAEAGAVADEVLSSIRTVMAFNAQELELARYEKKIRVAYYFGKNKGLVLGVGVGFIMFFIYGIYAIGFWFGSTRIVAGEYDMAKVLNVFMALLIGSFTLSGVAPNLSIISSGQGAAARVFYIIERESPIDAVDDTKGIKIDAESGQRLEGNIEFRDVHFRYPSRPDVKILHGFNLDIKKGQKIALVGESGCGKSTTIGLIERFYDPEGGDIIVDGINVKEYNVRSLRQQIGIVTQEPVLFSTSIHQNIVWGAIDPENNPPTQEEVIAAAKAANAHDFISSLPDGYDTLVGESGALLSGGQKQRIAIARALIRNPSILLLDEATSALDTESEKLVQDALDRISASRTTISIAHRLSTIRHCDQIYVVKKGVVSEHGTHDSLVAKGGQYASMVKAQELRQAVRVDGQGGEEVEEKAVEDLIREEQERARKAARRTSTRRSLANSLGNNLEAGGDNGKQVGLVFEQKAEPTSYTPKNIVEIYKRNLRFLKIWIVAGGFALIDGAVMPCFTLLFARMLNVFASTDKEYIKDKTRLYAPMFLIFSVVGFFAIFGRFALFGIGSEVLTRQIRYHTFKTLLRQDAGFFDDEKNGTGALTAQLSTDAEDVNKVGSYALPQLVSSISTLITGIVISFVADWKLSLIALACLPILGFANYLQTVATRQSSEALKSSYELSGQAAAETITNIKTVTTLSREHTFIKIFYDYNNEPHQGSMKSTWYASLGYGFSQAALLLVFGLIFYTGALFVTKQGMDIQDMFNVLYATMFMALSIGQLSQFATIYTKGIVAADAIIRLWDRKTGIDGTLDEGETAAANQFEGRVEIEDVEFAYPIRPKAKILRGITFEAKPGQTVALVGGSGSGKSTSIALIQRLYDVLSGHVFVEDIDVRNWNIKKLRDNMSIVSQEPTLFNLTVAENVSYGKPGATQQDIEQACKEANIYNFIASLPDGFDTQVGQKGGRLSGGQKQRIAIARAMVRKPRLLLLDEATSALDSESEKVVQKVLDKAKLGRTTVTIAHRLSTIQDSDLICVFQRGEIVERGTHDELLKLKGVYSGLVRQQSLEVSH
ncbi:hypothetical protein H4219_001746 [Mycoemilia scoparia]|uniref:Uncharacterized protein n=1 Tax=Mycoemilia scoparia TaxID=417184 RepID=A0A9W8A2V8_9FUNG|nr:hypothetical protein H4219_001746 [Mycoemilia scoparia]